MKKTMAACLLLALLLCLGGCGGKSDPPVSKFDIVGDWQRKPDDSDPLDFGALHLKEEGGGELVLERAIEPEQLGSELIGRYVRKTDAGDLIYEFYPDGRALLIRGDLDNWVYSLRWTYDAVAGFLQLDAYGGGSIWDTVSYHVKLEGDTFSILNDDGTTLDFMRE